MGKSVSFDEMGAPHAPRLPYRDVARWIEAESVERLRGKSADAERLFRRGGVTFAVYGEGGDPERLIPFDLIPRVLTAKEWRKLRAGVIQRAKALNAFLADLYGEAEIVKAGVVPAAMIEENPGFEPRLRGVTPPGGVYTHIVGVDIVRVDEDEFYILEDNCRTPSGVSYMLENREIMMRLFPDLFNDVRVAPVEGYPLDLRATLQSVAPDHVEGTPNVVIMTPGTLNSAYYEHSFLSDQTGLELVQGADLYCADDRVWMRTTRGPQRVDVIYRRIDDDFLDPSFFRPESMLGVPGLMDVYRQGGVTLVSAPGAGVADDKAVYTYVPDVIRFYLGEEPILPNVPTWRCSEPDALAYVLDNLADLVVKETQGSGGYGMLIGPKATAEERAAFADKLRAKPDGYIAQPTLSLSTCPSLVEEGVAPRHVDLRPFALVGRDEVRLTSGGLTRVALKSGSLVVNSSQGGGVKDTWVLSEGRAAFTEAHAAQPASDRAKTRAAWRVAAGAVAAQRQAQEFTAQEFSAPGRAGVEQEGVEEEGVAEEGAETVRAEAEGAARTEADAADLDHSANQKLSQTQDQGGAARGSNRPNGAARLYET